MNKKFVIFLLCTQIYHRSLFSFNIGTIWQKTEQEQIVKEYDVEPHCTITLSNNTGSCHVKHWNQPKIRIEAVKKGSSQDLKNTTLSCSAKGTDASIITRVATDQKPAQVTYTLTLPEDATLRITQAQGPVKVKGITGDIDISLEEGSIEITDSEKTVTAKTGLGDIIVHQKKFDDPYSIFLQSHRGNITLHLPSETKATLQAKTHAGSILSDHLVTLAPLSLKLNKDEWERLKKNIEGTLGGLKGGAPITLEATKGTIRLKEY